mmetsp:Transcript_78286/g.227033  ORF Transcript_78286/g.227033 Transcript_78286/m.227033 type:complete len:381 (+) Transcript_78286:2-1144(+)
MAPVEPWSTSDRDSQEAAEPRARRIPVQSGIWCSTRMAADAIPSEVASSHGAPIRPSIMGHAECNALSGSARMAGELQSEPPQVLKKSLYSGGPDDFAALAALVQPMPAEGSATIAAPLHRARPVAPNAVREVAAKLATVVVKAASPTPSHEPSFAASFASSLPAGFTSPRCPWLVGAGVARVSPPVPVLRTPAGGLPQSPGRVPESAAHSKLRWLAIANGSFLPASPPPAPPAPPGRLDVQHRQARRSLPPAPSGVAIAGQSMPLRSLPLPPPPPRRFDPFQAQQARTTTATAKAAAAEAAVAATAAAPLVTPRGKTPRPSIAAKDLASLQQCSSREQSFARRKAMELATVPELPAAVAMQFAQLSMLPDVWVGQKRLA